MFTLVLINENRHFKKHCCAEMTEQVNAIWPKAKNPLSGSTDQRIYWSPVFNEYGLICQPSAEILKIKFCPFCGKKLPKSRREKWFKQIKISGWENFDDPIPKSFLRHDWK